MSAEAQTAPPLEALLKIDFLIIGAGIAGLASAVALRRIGHRVTVLEKDDGSNQTSGGCRMPPNMSKILLNWGFEEELREISLIAEAMHLMIYESGEFIGTHRWTKEIIKEAGGSFMFTHHRDLLQLLKTIALSSGAEIRHNAEVVSIDSTGQTVTLANGDVLTADVVVGADGPDGISRRSILKDSNVDCETNSSLSGTVIYNTTIPAQSIYNDTDLAPLTEGEHAAYTWMGNGCNAMVFHIGGVDEFSFTLTAPGDAPEGSWAENVPITHLADALASTHCEPRLHKLGRLAANSSLTRIPLKKYEELKHWVHSSGRMLVIGEAAHPIPARSFQGSAMAVEDAAALAKLFLHLLNPDQISSFLWAFQDLRQERCEKVLRGELGNLDVISYPPGALQQARDDDMRAKHAAGKGALDSISEWDQNKGVFGYNAEDAADEWWIQWGILRERAKENGAPLGHPLNVRVEHLVH